MPVLAAAAAVLAAAGLWAMGARRGADSASRVLATIEGGQVLLGDAPVETLRAGERYSVPPGPGAQLRLDDGTPLWIGGGGSFALASGPDRSSAALELDCGSLVCSAVKPLEVRSRNMRAFACGGFAMGVPGNGPVPRAGYPERNIWSDWLVAPGEAAEERPAPADRGPAVFLLLSGWTELRVGEEELSLVGRRAVFGGDGRPVLAGPPEGLLTSIAAEQLQLAEELRAAPPAPPGAASAGSGGGRQRRAALLELRIARLRSLGRDVFAAERQLAALGWPEAPGGGAVRTGVN